MFSCWNEAASRASRSKRCMIVSSAWNVFLISLMATGRSSDFCTALNTVAIPPEPSSSIIWYSSLIFFAMRSQHHSCSERVDFYGNNRNVVNPAVFVRGPDQFFHGPGRRPGPLQYPFDLPVLDHLGQAVGAEQEQVPLPCLDRPVVRDHLPVDPERPRDDVAVRAFLRLVRPDQAGSHLFGHHAVVFGDLFERAAAAQIRAAVAAVRQAGGLPLEQRRGHGRAHAGEVRVPCAGFEQPYIRQPESIRKRGESRSRVGREAVRRSRVFACAAVLHDLTQGLDCEPACHFSSGMTAYAVRDRVEAPGLIEEEAVLVVLSGLSLVR